MAEAKKNTTQNAENQDAMDMVDFYLEPDPNPNAAQEEFYSLNFNNYLIKRGVPVKIPRALYNIIMANKQAEAEARAYENEQALRNK